MKITALIYHDVLGDSGVDDSGFQGMAAASYKLTASRFCRHLDLIAGALGPSTPLRIRSRDDLVRPAEDLVLTFDDGGRSGTDRTCALLEARGWRAHFFITTNLIGDPGFMAAADLRRLHSAGHVIGTHSASHPARMSSLTAASILSEWRDSCARIADILGTPVVTGSVPGGFYSAEVAQMAAEAGVQVLFTSEPTRRVATLGDVSVIGRFSVTRRTADGVLNSLASGRYGAALAQQLAWSGKKVLKRLGGDAWLALRRRLFDLGVG